MPQTLWQLRGTMAPGVRTPGGRGTRWGMTVVEVTVPSIPTQTGRVRSTVLLGALQIPLELATAWVTAMRTGGKKTGAPLC